MVKPDFVDRGSGVSKAIEFFGDLKRETEKAFLFYDGVHEIWLPKSQIIEYDQVTPPFERSSITYRVLIPEWLAKKKEII